MRPFKNSGMQVEAAAEHIETKWGWDAEQLALNREHQT